MTAAINEAVFVLAELLNATAGSTRLPGETSAFQTGRGAGVELGHAGRRDRAPALPGGQLEARYCRSRGATPRSPRPVLLLERNRPRLPVAMRMEWGESLTHQGEWLAAVDVIWQEPSFQPKPPNGCSPPHRCGGKLGARALVQRAVLLPDTLKSIRRASGRTARRSGVNGSRQSGRSADRRGRGAALGRARGDRHTDGHCRPRAESSQLRSKLVATAGESHRRCAPASRSARRRLAGAGSGGRARNDMTH